MNLLNQNSRYFVPDEPILAALKDGGLKGVDVRIILPNRPAHLLVYLCSFSYYNEIRPGRYPALKDSVYR